MGVFYIGPTFSFDSACSVAIFLHSGSFWVASVSWMLRLEKKMDCRSLEPNPSTNTFCRRLRSFWPRWLSTVRALHVGPQATITQRRMRPGMGYTEGGKPFRTIQILESPAIG